MKTYVSIQAALDSGDYDCFGALAGSVLQSDIKSGKVSISK